MDINLDVTVEATLIDIDGTKIPLGIISGGTKWQTSL